MDGDGWLERIAHVRRWVRHGERAPHKPLLLLFAIGRLHRTGTSRVAYVDAEEPMQQLLRAYGPTGRKTTPAFPFHHLQTDGLWVVETEDGSDPGSAAGRLRSSGATGQLSPALEEALLADPRLMALAVRVLLDENFPESLHADICRMIGVDVEALEIGIAQERAAGLVTARRRDPRFRNDVLVAYEFRCAICRYDGRIGNEAVGLDAAHVRWWAFDGPDSIDNGLCLCSMHHKLFDRGVIGITSDLTVQVSRHFVGHSDAATELVLRHAGRDLAEPQPGLPPVAAGHVRWHTTEVFRTPPRAA